MAASDRRRQLIEAALDVFSQRGFGGATTKQIAAHAGVAEALVFRHFPTKEALYTAVIDSQLLSEDECTWNRELDRHMAREDDEAVIGCLIRRTLEHSERDIRFERLILFAALEGHGLAQARFQEVAEPHMARIVAYLKSRQDAGALVACEPHYLLLAIDGVAHFYGLATKVVGAPIPSLPLDQTVEMFTRLAMRGVCLPQFPVPNPKEIL